MFARPAFLAVALAIATLTVYDPVRHLPFINYDDDVYVTQNVHVQSGLEWDTVQWAFTTHAASNWHPLTWISHALDVQLFGLSATGPHVVNLLLHTLNVLLLFWVLFRSTGSPGRSAMVAALFALHPINVETVAWVAERKNLLSMTFFLLALGAYRGYAQCVIRSAGREASRGPHTAKAPGSLGRYALVVVLFALGLMAKPQIVTLPLVLLLWDYWPLRRMTGTTFTLLFREKLPLFVLAAASSWVTLQAHRAGMALRHLPLSMRLANAFLSYARYVKRAIWPRHLALFYPHPQADLTAWQVIVCAAFLLAVTALVLRSALFARRQRGEIANSEKRTENSAVLTGWLWFLITLLPMIGIIQVGEQAMADRYAYLSFIGLFLMFVWGVADWAAARQIPPRAQAAAGIAVLLALSVVTRHQLACWHDAVTLWTHTLEITRNNYLAEVDLGAALVQRGEVGRAMEHFRAATTIAPDDPLGNMYLGRYAQAQGNLSEAIAAYQRVIEASLDPSLRARAYRFMGYAWRAQGNEAEAQKCFHAAAALGY